MVYTILCSIIVIVVCIVFYFRYTAKVNERKNIEKIRAAWGTRKIESFYFDRIDRYAELAQERGYHQLSKQTIDDIDFYGLFSFIDRTSSRIGQQFLFKKLIHPVNTIEELRALNAMASLVTDNPPLREGIQKELLRLSSNDAYYVTSLLQDKLLERPSWFKFLIINILTIIVLAALSFKYPVLLIVLLIPITVNTFLHYWNKGNAFQFIKSFPQLSLLIDVCSRISGKDVSFRNRSVEESILKLKPFQWKLGLLNFADNGGIKDDLSMVASYFIELLKAFFLIELFTLFHLTKVLEEKKDSILTLFKYAGEIDVAISVASLRAGTSKTCQPDFIQTSKELAIRSMHHPLIEKCVENDIYIRSRSVLITGSNMSGKTTFLRTLIINSILAQTIYTCFAEEFRTPVLKQFSSIRIDDNLFEGKSYYFEEVNVMASLIHEVGSGDQNIFVLDEVFKGTNTVERIASAKAILSYLNRDNNIVIVSTHDIELSEMLEKEYDLYHFTETIENDQLHFDHKIKAGQLKTRNAIKILEMSNYPEDIINEAKSLSLNLTTG